MIRGIRELITQGMRKAMLRISAVMFVLNGVLGTVFARNSPGLLAEGFKTPPNSAKPRTFGDHSWIECAAHDDRAGIVGPRAEGSRA